MKTKSIRRIIIFIGIGILSFFQIQSQTNTALSGYYTLSNTQSAGNGTTVAVSVAIGKETCGGYYGHSTTIDSNSCVGSYAGGALYSSKGNTFFGYVAGLSSCYQGIGNGFNSNTNWNTFIGSYSGSYNTQGVLNTFVGYNSGGNLGYGIYNSGTTYNVFIGASAGYQAGYSSNIDNNNFLGCNSGNNNSADNNNFWGYQAGYNNTSGVGNSIFGDNAGKYNQTGSYNSIFGNSAGYGNGSANSYSANSFFGYQAGYGATTGGNNVFLGIQSGYTNTTGTGNSSAGYQALYANSTGSYNCAVGQQALNVNTGSNNDAFGTNTLLYNTSGAQNCAMGFDALLYNVTSGNNTAIGHVAIYQTVGSSGTGCNTAIGYSAGSSNTTGTYNTYVGYLAQAGANNYANSTAIGNGATTTNSNTINLGTSATTYIYSNTGVWNYSDGRFKINVLENVKGLEFIKKLRPVTYNIDAKSVDNYVTQNSPDSIKKMRLKGLDFTPASAIIHSGFIAQEVEQASQDVGFKSSIVHKPENDIDTYSLNYAEIVVPLVKGIQEQQVLIDSLTKSYTKQDSVNKAFQNQIITCCTSNKSVGALFKNPLHRNNQQTNIEYFIPTTAQNASIVVCDLQGNPVKIAVVTNFGNGAMTINANELNPGMFDYTLVVDGKRIDSKRMILTQ